MSSSHMRVGENTPMARHDIAGNNTHRRWKGRDHAGNTYRRGFRGKGRNGRQRVRARYAGRRRERLVGAAAPPPLTGDAAQQRADAQW